MMDFLKSLTTARMSGETVLTTGGIALLGAWCLARVQALAPVLIVLLVTMILDYITGLVKAGMTGEINSTKGWQGLLKKLMYVVTVAIALVAVGALFYHEAITLNKLIGIALCLGGLAVMNR